MKLSDGEKLILLMLADMYKNLKIKGDFDPDFISRTIHDNHLWGFNHHYSGIPFEGEEDRPPEVAETINILDMWSFLEDSYKGLSAADKKKVEKDAEPFGKNPKFNGFDGNNEDHYHIANYVVRHLESFPSFKGRDLNAHMPTIDGYRRMYVLFDSIRPKLVGRLLTADEVVKILNVRRHPGP